MLTTKLIVRVLDDDGALLAWTEVMAEARGDGCLWPKAQTFTACVEQSGTPASLSVHWADVNIEVRTPLAAGTLVAGAPVTLSFHGQPAMIVGQMPGALPPVTVRAPISISMPVGALGAVAR